VKILLLGGSGMLGGEFRRIFEREKIDFIAPPHDRLDLTSPDSVALFFQKNPPESFEKIVHCAGWTDVNRAEIDRGACREINVLALQRLLEKNIPIIHFSTDYVFGNTKNIEIPEDFRPSPLNFYGKTKRQAETLLETGSVPWWNVRTSWLIGMGGPNFVSKILERIRHDSAIRVVDDQVGRPTFCRDLAKSVFKNLILKSPDCGHFHLQNSGPAVSWAELAEYVLKYVGWVGSLEKITADQLERAAVRPKNSCLKNSKLPPLPDWRESLESFLEQLTS
jgi:dTDP-4-dehydrorhamnose reductase